jgi:hypothetical protein
MIRKYALLSLGVLLACANTSYAFSDSRADKEARRAAQVQKEIAKHGTGDKARVRVKMKNGLSLKGCVKSAGSDSFELIDPATSNVTVIAYADVAEVKGKGLTGGQKLLIVFVVASILGLIANPEFAR